MTRTTLTISTDSRSYTVQGTSEDVNALFDRLVRNTFRPVDHSAGESRDPIDCGEPDICEEVEAPVEEHEEKSAPDMPEPTVHEECVEEATEECGDSTEPESNDTEVEEVEEDKPRKYRGFLLIKCEHCGAVKGFNSRYDISKYKCDCGGETNLGKLVPLTALCECGKRWRYLTNIKEDSYEINCIHCGSPIPVFFNDRKGKYETLMESLPPQRGKKKKKAKKGGNK